MATSIATGALPPRVAVAVSAVLNLIGAFLSIEVAHTISSGLVDETRIGPAVVFGGLIGATWVVAGADAVRFAAVVDKVLVPAVASPLIAGLVAAVGTFVAYRLPPTASRLTRGTRTATRGFRYGQIASASLVSLAHGTNDAQKTMGVITLTLITAGTLPAGAEPPLWVIVSAGVAIALGTWLGGWRIIHTMGRRITDVESPQGFAAETSAATVILTSSQLGFALSTTHVCAGGVVGSGVGKRLADVRWTVAGRMVVAWLLTLPAAAVVGALAGETAAQGTAGVLVVAVIGVIVGAGAWILPRRNPVGARNV